MPLHAGLGEVIGAAITGAVDIVKSVGPAIVGGIVSQTTIGGQRIFGGEKPFGVAGGQIGPPTQAEAAAREAAMAVPVLQAGINPSALIKLAKDLLIGGIGGAAGVGLVGGMNGGISGSASLYHTTPMGNRRPNRMSLQADPESGRMDFFVYAGIPTAWSKITLKKPHRHGHPRHHRGHRYHR